MHADPKQKAIVEEINRCNGLPDMRSTADCIPAGESVGFKAISAEDLVYKSGVAWYSRMKMGWFSHLVTHASCWIMEKVGYAPKGTVAVSNMLMGAAKSLIAGGEQEIFTPFYFVVFEKPRR